jgi:quercetin dioxygenase-like cupin family protein
MPRFVSLGALLTLVALTGGKTLAQAPPPGQIEEMVLVNNDSVRLVLITYAPGADSDLHLNVGPDVTIVQEGELVMFAQGRREVLHPGEAH